MAERASIAALPDALDQLDELLARVGDRRLIVFCDYDGVLAPIVRDPAAAKMTEPARRALERLARVVDAAIVSGRDLDDVRHLAGLGQLWYAGSHGFDVAGPGGEREQYATEYLPALEGAEQELRARLETLPGARIDRKRFAVAVHYREVSEDGVPAVEEAVDDVVGRDHRLRKSGGKRVFELRPAVDWDKGRAVLALLQVLDADREAIPIFMGDDITDEDAFEALRGHGIGIVVRGEDDQRATAADYALADPAAAPSLLDALAAHAERM